MFDVKELEKITYLTIQNISFEGNEYENVGLGTFEFNGIKLFVVKDIENNSYDIYSPCDLDSLSIPINAQIENPISSDSDLNEEEAVDELESTTNPQTIPPKKKWGLF